MYLIWGVVIYYEVVNRHKFNEISVLSARLEMLLFTTHKIYISSYALFGDRAIVIVSNLFKTITLKRMFLLIFVYAASNQRKEDDKCFTCTCRQTSFKILAVLH